MARTAFLLLAAALASAGTPEEAVRAFRRAYESKDPTVRRKAVALLEEVAHPSATEALLPALSDEDGRVRSRKDVGVYFIPMTGAMMNRPRPAGTPNPEPAAPAGTPASSG